MSLLGVNWHNIGAQSVAIASQAAAYSGFTTLQHSLLTTPDLVMPILRSVAVTSVPPELMCIGGNASLATIGYCVGAASAFPVFAFDVFAIYLWSGLR